MKSDTQTDNEKIIFQIGPSQLKSQFAGANKFHVYALSGSDKNGEFNSQRKYVDFQALRIVLVAKWPGFFIPPLPERKLILVNQQVAQQIRRKGLINFLKTLSQNQYIWNSEQLQTFLRIVPQECQKTLLKLKQIHLTNILAKYENIFPQFFKKEISQQLNIKITQFDQFLKKSVKLLQNLQKMAVQMENSNKKTKQKYFNMIEITLPEYQKNCILTYKKLNSDHHNILAQLNVRNIQDLKKFKSFGQNNSIVEILISIKRQKSQIQSFQQIIKVRQYFLILKNKATSKLKEFQIQYGKLKSGKQSIFSKITKKSKQDQLKQNQLNIQKAIEQQKNLSLLHDVITAIIVNKQIDKFKKNREKQYYKLIKRFCHLEILQSKSIKNYWSSIENLLNNQTKIETKKEKLQGQIMNNHFNQNSKLKQKTQVSINKINEKNQTNKNSQHIQQDSNQQQSKDYSLKQKKQFQNIISEKDNQNLQQTNQNQEFQDDQN